MKINTPWKDSGNWSSLSLFSLGGSLKFSAVLAELLLALPGPSTWYPLKAYRLNFETNINQRKERENYIVKGTMTPFCVHKKTKNALQIMSLTAYAKGTKKKTVFVWEVQ